MLHVIFTILKVLGLIIAVILGIIILLLASVLFVPIRYKIKGQYYEKATGDARLHWLFHILNAWVGYNEEGLRIRLRVMCFVLYDNTKEEKEKKPKKVKQKKSKQTKS